MSVASIIATLYFKRHASVAMQSVFKPLPRGRLARGPIPVHCGKQRSHPVFATANRRKGNAARAGGGLWAPGCQDQPAGEPTAHEHDSQLLQRIGDLKMRAGRAGSRAAFTRNRDTFRKPGTRPWPSA
jgi:hypothetical protein